VKEITVHHLLTHTGGGWQNNRSDPMFLHPEMGHHELIEWTLQHAPLTHAPGTHYAYSNFGYCVLGRVLEKITSLPYPEAVQREILSKCEINQMRISGNTAADRAKNEVAYYGPPEGAPYRMNVARMDSHGGWLATAADLVRFAMHVDGFATTRNILKRDTITAMTTPSRVNPEYACGWSVTPQPNWWHSGSLPGTSSIMVRTARGLCWAALANIRSAGIGPALDRLMWQIVRAVPAWKA
jgi:CubicO group peptidase (beta-lactamase class C family)